MAAEAGVPEAPTRTHSMIGQDRPGGIICFSSFRSLFGLPSYARDDREQHDLQDCATVDSTSTLCISGPPRNVEGALNSHYIAIARKTIPMRSVLIKVHGLLVLNNITTEDSTCARRRNARTGVRLGVADETIRDRVCQTTWTDGRVNRCADLVPGVRTSGRAKHLRPVLQGKVTKRPLRHCAKAPCTHAFSPGAHGEFAFKVWNLRF